MSSRTRSTIEAAALKMRELALACGEGELLGSEDSLIDRIGVSRATVRQAARLLEREGFLRVRRGINGGYFAGRPNLSAVEAAVSAYLDTLDMEATDVTVVASVLWIEAVRRAALVPREAARAMVARLQPDVSALTPDAGFARISEVERLTRTEVFALTRARYIELIFQINIAFAQKRFPPTSQTGGAEDEREFAIAWRRAKLMELEAIYDGDPDLAVLAARHSRNLWHERIWRDRQGDEPASG